MGKLQWSYNPDWLEWERKWCEHTIKRGKMVWVAAEVRSIFFLLIWDILLNLYSILELNTQWHALTSMVKLKKMTVTSIDEIVKQLSFSYMLMGM